MSGLLAQDLLALHERFPPMVLDAGRRVSRNPAQEKLHL
jgi:hypothetical protein